MLADAVQHAYTRARWGLLLRALIALSLGIFIIARPLESVAAFALVIAIWALVSGTAQIVDGIELRSMLPHWWLLIVGGLVSVGFGVAAFYYYPALSLVYAVIWASYWLLVSGFFSLYIAVQERRTHSAWGWTAAFGVAGVLAGVYAIMAPPVTLTAIMALMATFALIGGVILLMGFFKVGAVKTALSGAAAAAQS
jgi:uncharacterized membrane protein HdeD (DUF308 family)